MQTSTNTRIRALTDRGFWGQDSLHGLLAERVTNEPNALAVADQPDKMGLVGQQPARLSFSDLDIASTALASTVTRPRHRAW